MEHFTTDYLIPLLGSLLATLMSILLAFLIAWVKRKTGIEIQQAESDRLLRNIQEAIGAVEEKARAELKIGLPKWTSDMKYKWVLDYIGNKFPTLSKEEADKKINAMLARWRLEEACCDPKVTAPAGWTITNTIPPQAGSGVCP